MYNFHSSSVKECLAYLKSDYSGLTNKEVVKRIKKHGDNKIKEAKSISRISIFFSQFKSPLILILLVAGLVSFFLRDYVDTSVIFAAVFLNTVIGFFQENKANQALVKLKKMVVRAALVVRDGKEMEVDSQSLTIGDVIILQAGNRVPADARLIESIDLSINESNLTGESVPSNKNIKINKPGSPLADRDSMVYSGTVIISGSGKAVVCSIGANTEMGKISMLVQNTKEEKTPLQAKLISLSKKIGIFVTVMSLLIVLVGILQGRGLVEMIITGVALSVAAIPEGLVVAVTVILVLGMQQILKENALTRKLVAAETLGSVTVICCDKTGTLTEGKMQVAHIIVGEKEFALDYLGSRQNNEEARIVSLALQTGMMCNDAFVENPEDELEDRRMIGTPTETALLYAAYHSGLDREKLLLIEPKINELPFSSERKYMISLHKKKNGTYQLYEKGAGERLLKKSTQYFNADKLCVLDDSEKARLIKTYEKLTSKGLRVISVAIREINQDEFVNFNKKNDWETVDHDLVFVGFIALKDPLRKEAKETIDLARQAGIMTVIITGDHKLTAKAIALDAGMKVQNENIMTGEELDKISDEKLSEIVKKIEIYARVSPHHKYRIIKALQSRGEVVAMTGDGINDAPALKAADIGVSLGTGTDVAKETADIILLDNNFKTIVSAVKQGRIIFENIRKVITYLTSDGFSEVILIVGSILFATPLAILPAQILWINIINDGLPNFSLSLEKGDKDIMKQKPISRKEPIINREMKAIIFGVGLVRDSLILSFFVWLYQTGAEIVLLRTLFFAILGFKSLITIFSLRSLKTPIWKINFFANKYLLLTVSSSFILLLLAIYLPWLQTILNTVPLGLYSWILVLSVGIISLSMTEATKYYYAVKN